MADLRLTDLSQATGVTIDDLIHIVITGDTTQYSGGSSYKASINQVFDSLSGYCVPDLYVSNLHSCSPLNINPLDEGGVYFGSTSGITLDVTNKRIGINTSTPQYTLDIKGGQSNLYYDPTSVGGRLAVSGTTNVPRFGVEVPPYLTKLQATMSIGMRAWDDTLYPDYGNLGDAHLYAGVNAYGLNIISEYGVNSADYIRFYAGQDASSGNTPDMYIQGSGSTRGYVGIGTSSPTEKLEVSGNTLINGTLSATTIVLSGSNITSSWTSYVPTWTALSSNPVIGNGTITGAYKVIGKTCFVRGRITMGSSTTYGSGAWLIGLPLPAINAYAIQIPSSLLNNGTAWYSGLMNGGRNGNTSYSEIQVQNTGGTADGISSTYPFTWGDTDELSFNGSYEIA